jgi:hypothetical protein
MSQDPETASELDSTTWTYRAVVEAYEDRPDQCTIFPREAAGIDRMSTWITAREGSYVSIEKMR